MPKPFTGVSANGHHHHFTLIDDERQQRLPRPRRPGPAVGDRAQLPRRHARPLPGADVRRQPDGQLLLPHVGHRLLGPDLQELGLAEPHDDGARRLRRALRVPRRRLVLQPVPDGRRAAARRPRRHPQQDRPRASRSRATPTSCSQEGVEIEKVPDSRSAPRSRRSRPTRSSASAMPGRLYKVFNHYKRDEWERYLAAVTDWERDEYLEVLPVAMCGSQGSSTATASDAIGRDMTRMLQSMKHRGPDSTGYALYGPPRRRLSRCASSSPTPTRRATSSSTTALRRHRAEVERRLRRGRRDATPRIEDATEYAFNVHVRLRRRPQGARRPRRGRAAAPRCSRSATRWRSSRTSATPRRSPASTGSTASSARHAIGHVPDGDRVRRRHLGRAPVLGVSVLRHRGRPQRPAHELPLLAPAPGAQRAPLPVRVRLGDHRRLPRRADGRGRRRSRTPCARASRSSTASSPTSA